MEFLHLLWTYVVPFLAILTVLVFVHELGHYIAARLCGVRVDVFSIGFGPEIWGFNDRAGTRWKLSAIPFGGYVKMFAERPSEEFGDNGGPPLDESEKAVSFYGKKLSRRAAIVFAGPLSNFLFAILVLAGLFCVVGQPYTPADIGAVIPGSAAARAGLKPGDVFKRIDDHSIDRFEQVRQIVQMSPGKPIRIVVLRNGQDVTVTAVPEAVQVTRFGSTETVGQLGVTRTNTDMVLVRYDPLTALWRATQHTATLSVSILDSVEQIITGQRTAKELGGPVRIAQISGDMAQAGLVMVIQFAAILSINLGLINLFPIPMLDGGHLLFYGIEAVRGRPVGERAMSYSLNIGLALIFCLTLFVTWNDLVQLRVFERFLDLVT